MTNRVLSWYVRAVLLTGGAVVAYSAATLGATARPLEWFVFAALAMLIGRFMLNVGSVEASISVGDTLFIAIALLFGPGPAAVALAADSFWFSYRKRHDRTRIAFNTAAPALSMWVAAQAFFALAGVPPLATGHVDIVTLLVPLACLTTIYYALNSGLLAIAVGLTAKQSPLAVWRQHFLWLSLNYFAAGSLALCLLLVIAQVGLGAVAVVLPVLAIFHLTLRSSFGRVDDARRHVSELDRLYKSTVETLAMAIDAKDDVTHSHVRRVQAYATALAQALDVRDEPTLKAIEAAALLHDTGKLAVPERILNKPGGLTPAEFEEMKRHVDVGADILALVDFPYPVVPIVRCHHENWDGTGYPRGVAGADIPIGARILSVVDCFDALTSDRPYRRRMTDEAALDILRQRRGRMYDPAVVDMFAKIYRDVPIADIEAPEEREVLQQISRAAGSDAPAVAKTLETKDSAPAAVRAYTAVDSGVPVSHDVLAFVSLSRLAAGTVSLSDVLALTTNLVRGIVPGATGGWFLVSDAGDRLQVADAFGPRAGSVSTLTVRVGERLTGWVAANRQVIVNSDAALDLCGREEALKSCLSVPLLSGESLVGVLTLYGEQPDSFTDDQGRLVEMIAPHIALAVQTARERGEARPVQAARELKLVAAR